ncbi:MAG TPA: serine/threonine-protein kinase [Planctomycetota bacterium]|nr:serine/threonine-protein kinase [Planctomycetota bacterium]
MMSVALEDARKVSWDAPPPRVGSRIEPREVEELLPQFEIHDLLGQGGMGVVFKARHKAKRRWVALKLLFARQTSERAFNERFAREARALESLNHPNIVALHESGEVQGRFYLAMEYVEGRTLRDLLRTGQLSSKTTFDIIRQLCDALEAAHTLGFVHRDLKPENVLINNLGSAKLADFGLAKLRALDAPPHTLTGEMETMGTPHYMAPEQIERPRSVDHRADLFSLGVLFYELLTGELPLGRFQPPSQLSSVDSRIDNLILRALDKNPAKRQASAAAFRADLEHILTTPHPVHGADERLRRLRLDERSPHKPWSLVRGFIVIFPIVMLIGFLRDAMTSSLLVLVLATFALFVWGERLVNARDRLTVHMRLYLLAGSVAALGALYGFAPIVGRWAYGLMPGVSVSADQIVAIRCIAAVSLAHLLWAAWRSWDSFRPRPTRVDESKGS